MIQFSSFSRVLKNDSLCTYFSSSQNSIMKKIWLPVLFLHSKLQKASVVQKYTFVEEPNVHLNILKTVFEATTVRSWIKPPTPRPLIFFQKFFFRSKKIEQCETYLSIWNSIKSHEIFSNVFVFNVIFKWLVKTKQNELCLRKAAER